MGMLTKYSGRIWCSIFGKDTRSPHHSNSNHRHGETPLQRMQQQQQSISSQQRSLIQAQQSLKQQQVINEVNQQQASVNESSRDDEEISTYYSAEQQLESSGISNSHMQSQQEATDATDISSNEDKHKKNDCDDSPTHRHDTPSNNDVSANYDSGFISLMKDFQASVRLVGKQERDIKQLHEMYEDIIERDKENIAALHELNKIQQQLIEEQKEQIKQLERKIADKNFIITEYQNDLVGRQGQQSRAQQEKQQRQRNRHHQQHQIQQYQQQQQLYSNHQNRRNAVVLPPVQSINRVRQIVAQIDNNPFRETYHHQPAPINGPPPVNNTPALPPPPAADYPRIDTTATRRSSSHSQNVITELHQARQRQQIDMVANGPPTAPSPVMNTEAEMINSQFITQPSENHQEENQTTRRPQLVSFEKHNNATEIMPMNAQHSRENYAMQSEASVELELAESDENSNQVNANNNNNTNGNPRAIETRLLTYAQLEEAMKEERVKQNFFEKARQLLPVGIWRYRVSDGPFVEIGTCGEGANGKVKVGYYRNAYLLGLMAIKKLTVPLDAKQEFAREYIMNELVFSSKLSFHSNICYAREIVLDETNNKVHIISSHMRWPLDEFVKTFARINGKGIPDTFALYILHQAVKGLIHLQTHMKFFHADIKGGNILIGADGQVKITDLGMTRRMGQNRHKGGAGSGSGTFGWMAPEVARMDARWDERSDIWSLGMTLIEMLDGGDMDMSMPGFNDNTDYHEAFAYTANITSPPICGAAPFISRFTRYILHWTLRMNPAERFKMGELEEELRFITSGITQDQFADFLARCINTPTPEPQNS